MRIDPKWLERQVQSYAAEKRRYKTYASNLKAILEAAAARYAPDSIVQAREKALGSFAEKAIRKRDKYDKPAFQLTDLCGARVTVFTQSQMEAIGQFVRENFTVDEANSDDAGARLKPSEFGYRSVHLVVQVTKPAILGVTVPLGRIGKRKAEIQVRTLLQHAWASITHDRLYKGGFKPPHRLERTSSRLSALLEDAEKVVEDFESGIQEYIGNYFTYLEPKKLQDEIHVQQLILAHEDKKKRVPTALKLAKLCRSAGNPGLAIETIKSIYKFVPDPLRVAVELELGAAYLQRGRAKSSPQDVEAGLQRLRLVANLPQEDAWPAISSDRVEEKLRSEAAALIAETSARDIATQGRASEFFNLALQRDPSDPYHLVSLFQFRPALTQQGRIIEAARPALLRAVEVCRRHLDAGLELPRAWLTTARLHFLLEQPYLALDCYAKALHFYRTNPWNQEDFEAEITFLQELRNKGLRGHSAWMQVLLRIGWAVKHDQALAVEQATGRPVVHRFPKDRQVLICAGGTAAELESELAHYGNLIKDGLDGFDGIVISGGTTSGVPGRVGAAAKALRVAGQASFDLVGYHPRTMPARVTLEENYDSNKEVPPLGDEDEVPADFSAAEPLQNWIDLLASGVNPGDVHVLGINGGDISRFEYALALALGATVGVLESSGRKASETCRDPDWSKLPTLLPLPDDPMTIQAFVHWSVPGFTDQELERMGRTVHQFYLPDNPADRSYKNPSSLPWEYVPEDFRVSSRQQAAYASRILRRYGYGVRKSGRKPGAGGFPRKLPKRVLERMAEMEHGRWNVERLRKGWRYAPKKDTDKRLSPYLVAWKQLPNKIKNYDRKAVRYFPNVFAAANYKIVKV